MSGESDTPGRTVRRLMRSADRATLATLLAEGDGVYPYASLALVAFDWTGAPLLLISDLAEHTRNLKRDPRASLLFDGTQGLADPLTGARATVLGEITPVADERRLLDRYVARHPSAAVYRGFRDFRLYRMQPDRAHLVAGFGRIHWVEAAAFLAPEDAATALAAAEPDILAHMNQDHGATIDLFAQHLLGLGGEGWRLSGVDPDGADLRRDAAAARLAFDIPATDADSVRQAFIGLAERARMAKTRT